MSHSILLVSWGSSGNLNPILTAARQLQRRGHSARVMADPAMRSDIEKAGFAYVAWNRAPIGNAADPSDFTDKTSWIGKAIFEPADDYAADLLSEIARVKTDAVICIDILFGAAVAAEAAGVPLALLSPHISLRPLPGVPPASSGLVPAKTEEERKAVAEAVADISDRMDGFLPEFNATRARFDLPPLQSIWEIFDRAERCLLAISKSFDFEADALPENFRYIGPLLDEPGWAKPWQSPWPAGSGRPRVLIACSTGAQGQKDFVQRALNAVGLLQVDAVVTTGPNLSPSELTAPANVTVFESAPHNAVMREVSVVVTQGGHGTVSRCLINGVPQLVLPQQRDQADNAARIETKGAGLRLPSDASETAIAAAVNWLVTEPRFGQSARSLGAAMKADMAASNLCREIEAIVIGRRIAA
jgi:MGT family glycosyltransferase